MAGAGNAQAMTVTMAVSTILTFLFMSLRFYCKQYLGTKLALDDLVLAFSWVRISRLLAPTFGVPSTGWSTRLPDAEKY